MKHKVRGPTVALTAILFQPADDADQVTLLPFGVLDFALQ